MSYTKLKYIRIHLRSRRTESTLGGFAYAATAVNTAVLYVYVRVRVRGLVQYSYEGLHDLDFKFLIADLDFKFKGSEGIP